MAASQFEVARWESIDLMSQETVGRLCVLSNGYPLAFPINYRIVQDGMDIRVVFRAAPHAAVAQYQGPASMEVDQIDASHECAWSVIVRGNLHRVFGQDELPDTYPLLEGRHQWMVLEVTAVSGRRFVSTPSFDGQSVEWRPAIG